MHCGRTSGHLTPRFFSPPRPQAKAGAAGGAPKPPPPPPEEKKEEEGPSFKAFQGKGFSLKG